MLQYDQEGTTQATEVLTLTHQEQGAVATENTLLQATQEAIIIILLQEAAHHQAGHTALLHPEAQAADLVAVDPAVAAVADPAAVAAEEEDN